MTEARQAEVLDFGWEVMKYMSSPTIALWLADDGWDGGVTIQATRDPDDPPKTVRVALKNWDTLVIHASQNPN